MNFSCMPQHDERTSLWLASIGTTSIAIIVWFYKTMLKLPKWKLWDEKHIRGGYVNVAMITEPLNTKLILTRKPE